MALRESLDFPVSRPLSLPTGVSVFLLALLAVLATRLPLMPDYLYDFDSVNLALAMKEFDPARHQPQPPGYPFFVAESRLMALLLSDPVQTFHALEIILSSLVLSLIYLAAGELGSARAGWFAAALLFVHPVFWYAGLTSPLRLHAAALSLLIAVCCWKVLQGKSPHLYAAALAIGLGGGFRPVAAAMLLPLWIWCAWKCQNRPVVVRSAIVMAVASMFWIAPIVWAYGGWQTTWNALLDYLLSHSQSAAAASGDQLFQWRRMIGRALLWNFVGWIPLLLLTPLALRSRPRIGVCDLTVRFLALWFVPHFLFSMLVHVASPGHTLATVVAGCVAAGLFLDAASRRELPRVAVVGALVILWNTAMFLWPWEVPVATPSTAFRGWASVRDAASIGIYETSYARIRFREGRTSGVLQQIRRLKSETDRPVFVIWSDDASPVWRKLCYYFPTDPVYELIGPTNRRESAEGARLWVGNTAAQIHAGGKTVRLPVKASARLIWVISEEAVQRLRESVHVELAGAVFYTDLSDGQSAIRLGAFEFYPSTLTLESMYVR